MIDISMLRISPKLLNINGNRIGDYEEKRIINDTIKSDQVKNFISCEKLIPSYMTGRFPTQLFTNIKNDRYKYVKNIT